MSKRQKQKPKRQQESQESWPAEIPVLLFFLALVLVWAQFNILHRLGSIPSTDQFASPSLFWQSAAGTLALSNTDLLLLALIPAIVAILILIETLARRLSDAADGVGTWLYGSVRRVQHVALRGPYLEAIAHLVQLSLHHTAVAEGPDRVIRRISRAFPCLNGRIRSFQVGQVSTRSAH